MKNSTIKPILLALAVNLGAPVNWARADNSNKNPESFETSASDHKSEFATSTIEHYRHEGIRLIKEKKLEHALNTYTKCINLFPTEPSCYREAAIVSARLNKETEAVELYQKFLQVSKNKKPEYPDAIEDCMVNRDRQKCLKRLRKAP